MSTDKMSISTTRAVRIKGDGEPPANEHRPQSQGEIIWCCCQFWQNIGKNSNPTRFIKKNYNPTRFIRNYKPNSTHQATIPGRTPTVTTHTKPRNKATTDGSRLNNEMRPPGQSQHRPDITHEYFAQHAVGDSLALGGTSVQEIHDTQNFTHLGELHRNPVSKQHMGGHVPLNNRKENYTPLVTSKSQPSHIPTSRTHLRSQIQGHFNGNQPKALRNVTNHLPTPNKHKLLKTTNSSTMISPPQHAAMNHSLWIDRLLHGKPCAKYGLSTCNQITSVPETTHDETIAATSKKLLLCSQPKRLKPYEPSAQGRNPPANEHRPQPQVETATARRHSSHHNDSQTVYWFCQNWQQHQMISPRKMKLTVNQGNQLFTRWSFFTCKESPLEALSPGSIEYELIQYELSDEVKTSVHCVPEENCQTYRLGKVVWPSAKCLGDFAPNNADLLTDKSLVELDSGTGLCGLTAAHNCSRVVLTDNVKDVVTLLRKEDSEDTNSDLGNPHGYRWNICTQYGNKRRKASRNYNCQLQAP